MSELIFSRKWLTPTSQANNDFPLGRHVLDPLTQKTYFACQVSASSGALVLGNCVYDDLTGTNGSVVRAWATGVAKPGRIKGFLTGTLPTAGQYCLVQTGGPVAGRIISTNGDDDIAAGDRVSIKSSVTGLDKEITGTTDAALDTYFDVGYATAADSNTYDTCAINLSIFDLA